MRSWHGGSDMWIRKVRDRRAWTYDVWHCSYGRNDVWHPCASWSHCGKKNWLATLGALTADTQATATVTAKAKAKAGAKTKAKAVAKKASTNLKAKATIGKRKRGAASGGS